MFHLCTILSPHLTETLPCHRITHFLLCSCLIAVTRSAVRVTIETRRTAVTLTTNNVVFASKQKMERNIKINIESVTRRQIPVEGVLFSYLHCPLTLSQLMSGKTTPD